MTALTTVTMIMMMMTVIMKDDVDGNLTNLYLHKLAVFTHTYTHSHRVCCHTQSSSNLKVEFL